MKLEELQKSDLMEKKKSWEAQYNNFKAQGLKLNMARGKPSPAQLDLSMDMLNVITSASDLYSEDGNDCRNYGVLEGIAEARELFSKMIGVGADEIIICGNSSLSIMHNAVSNAVTHGIGGCTPWGKLDKVKFLCPVPGYDRHFAICEYFGIEMINIPTGPEGPDMDMIEKLVSEDESIKGIWCVPQYSNPTGIVYSDETVKRFAALKPAAKDFRIFWDNAYCVHHLTDNPKSLLNILDECKKAGTEDMVYIFGSTSKITFSGSGVAMIGASKNNINEFKSSLAIKTIGYDKINQLRHVRYFKDINGLKEHMKKHQAMLVPKFRMVLDTLEREIAPLGIAQWSKPEGGYFISLDSLPGCASRIVQLCKEGGVTLTGAGATYPYGKDPEDKNIRIAPTYPSVEELEKAMELFCICIKLASAEKLLG